MAQKIYSGGLKAVMSTLKHARQNGIVRGFSALASMNQKKGFDCPGCAWPEPEHRSRFEYCENGAKTLLSALQKQKLDAPFFRKNSLEDLQNLSDFELEQLGRLTSPAVKKRGASHFTPISYEEALSTAASALKNTRANRAAFYTSGRTSNEAAFLYQLFARSLGTNNLPDCSNLCHESSGVALNQAIGIGKGTVQLEDFLQAEVILLIGHNPATNHPRMLSTLKDAHKNGAKIVVINPIIEPGLKHFRHPQHIGDMLFSAQKLATHYFQIRLSQDVFLFYALAKMLLERDHIDSEFIHNNCHGFDEFKQSLNRFSLEDLEHKTGLRANEIAELAELLAKDRVIYAWGMGLTQNRHAVYALNALTNVALMRGHVGKPGAGLCPVRGHSNVQGNRTVGITEKPKKEFLRKLSETFDFVPPQDHGFDVVETIHAMTNGDLDFFMALGGNFLQASPDTTHTKAAMEQVDTCVFVATKLNRGHLIDAGQVILLPCLSRVEKDMTMGLEQTVSVENSMGIVHSSRGNFAPADSALMSEVAIIAELAQKTLGDFPLVWHDIAKDYARIRDLMEKCVHGFSPYNERLKNPHGFLLENAARNRVFRTKNHKANFFPARHDLVDLSNHSLLLTTIRSHDQFNTSIYGLEDRYRGVFGERNVIFMNADDAKARSLKHDDQVDITSVWQGERRSIFGFKVKIHEIKQGAVAAYFPEANPLIPLGAVAFLSNTPSSKEVPVEVKLASR